MAPETELRVDTARGLQWLAVEAWGHAVGVPLFLSLRALRALVRVEHVGPGAAERQHAAITCAWHEHTPATMLVLFPTRAPTVWLNHPAWYMRPIHLLLRWSGVDTLALGSSGHGGKAALERVVEEVRAGSATFLNPDGPRGPAHTVKDGVLELALRTGRPVCALSFRYRRALRLPTWDRKWFPLPGGVVEVRWSEPIHAHEMARDEARRAIAAALHGVG